TTRAILTCRPPRDTGRGGRTRPILAEHGRPGPSGRPAPRHPQPQTTMTSARARLSLVATFLFAALALASPPIAAQQAQDSVRRPAPPRMPEDPRMAPTMKP